MVDKTIEIIEILGRYVDESRDYSSVATKINALYTELVSEKEIDYAAHEAASKIGANTSSNESKYFKKGAKWLQQRQVIDKCDCPICGSDDTFSFQQGCHKCRTCDYRFTK